MSQKSKMFSDAIADAKALKETALNNAKISLAEAFTPRIESMISRQLNEMDEELDENLEENSDSTLEEVLDSLDENDEFDETQEEEEFTDEGGFEEEEGFEGEIGEEEVGEITVDELKDIMREVMSELDGTDEDLGMEDDFQDGSEEFEGGEEEEVDSIAEDMGTDLTTDNNALFQAVKAAIKKSPDFLKKLGTINQNLANGAGKAMRSEVKNLKEANTILKTTLKEVNLINSKLLYLNKIFKAKNLSENQKIKVINHFDKAKSIKETENIYSILKESLNNFKSKTKLRENRSFASGPSGVRTRSLNENVNPQINSWKNRMQELAGINQQN